mgnify:CR=1 FL=1
MKKNNLKLTRTHYSKKVYGSRVSRNKFVVTELSAYIGIKILGVGGGGERRLANHLPKDVEYIEIDMARAPDVIINLEKDMPLPFKDNSFDTVVCTDVLEHLENFHEVLDELQRVCAGKIIISLPNSTTILFNYLFRKKVGQDLHNQGKFSKFYGLPLSKPDDRHKWFFSYTEADAFFTYYAQKNNINIVESFPIGLKSASIFGWSLRKLTQFIFGKNTMLDFFTSAYWCVLDLENQTKT